mgnify:FL=1
MVRHVRDAVALHLAGRTVVPGQCAVSGRIADTRLVFRLRAVLHRPGPLSDAGAVGRRRGESRRRVAYRLDSGDARARSTESAGPTVVAHIDYGPLFGVSVVYSYLVVLGGLGLLIHTTFRARQRYRKQTALVALSAVVPLTGSVVTYVLDLTVIDYTPVGMAVFGVVFAVALTRYQLLDVYPVPRSEILQHVDKGIVATDPDGRIIDDMLMLSEAASPSPTATTGR